MDTPAIVAIGLAKRYGARTVFDDFSFTVNNGEAVAVTGPSGSGKSSLLYCLGLLEPLSGGSIQLLGRSATSIGPARRRSSWYASDIGFLFQNYALIDDATVRYNVSLGRPSGLWRRGSSQRTAEVSRALSAVGLDGYEERLVYELSGGEQQRVALARLLFKRPRIVLADEPTGALDSDNRAIVLDLMSEFTSAGAALVVVTHDPQVANWADRELTIG